MKSDKLAVPRFARSQCLDALASLVTGCTCPAHWLARVAPPPFLVLQSAGSPSLAVLWYPRMFEVHRGLWDLEPLCATLRVLGVWRPLRALVSTS